MLVRSLFLSVVFMLILVNCARESDVMTSSYLTHTKVPATDISIPTLTANKTEENGTCILAGGEIVKNGWSGKDTGANYCNQCRCLNFGLACTRMACLSIHSTTSAITTPISTPKATTISPTPTSVSVMPTPISGNVLGKVISVIDGDTIGVDIGGVYYTVRYIGIDTPETKHPTQSVEHFGLEATEKNRQLVANKIVRLEKDISETDKYNRLLRYVFVGDVMVNAVLVEGGYAEVSTYPPDVKYVELFLELQQQARESRRGLWNLDSMSVSQGDIIDCDSAYPTVCIPSPPPDLNCGDIQHRRFTVLATDPHRFDGDKDGIGCES